MKNLLKKVVTSATVALFLVVSLNAGIVHADRSWSPPDQTGHAGQFLQTDGVNTLWATPGGGGGGVTFVNGLSGSLNIVTGTAGSNFGIVSGGTTITLNLPQADATHTGKLSSADWSTFSGKQDALTFSDSLVNTAGTVTLVGDSPILSPSTYYGTDVGGAKGFFPLPSGTIGGSIAVQQVAFGDSLSNTITGTNDFTYNSLSKQFVVGFSGNRGLIVDQTSNDYVLGDTDHSTNGTHLDIDDGNEMVTINSSSHPGAEAMVADFFNNQYVFGAADGSATNHTKLFIDENSGTINLDSLYGGLVDPLVSVSGLTGSVAIGDTASGVNGTQLSVNDSSEQVKAITNGSFVVESTPASSAPLLSINFAAADTLDLGDSSGSFGGSNIHLDTLMGTATNSFVWDFGNTLVHGVSDPTSSKDAANKEYVDSFSNGLSWKTAVKASTTTTLPTYTYLSNVITEVGNGGLPAQDGVTLTNGQRLLVQNETGGNAPYNGIYVVTDVGSVSTPFILTRSADNNTSGEMTSATVLVTSGSTLSGMGFTQTSAAPTIGVTNIVWVNFLSSVYTAGSGLTLGSNVFSLNTAHANTWTAVQQFDSGDLQLNGATSGHTILTTATTTTIHRVTLPATVCTSGQVWTDNGLGVMSCTTPSTTLLLKTNGVTNSTQSLLDLTAGSGITLGESSGVVTITATGGGSGTVTSVSAGTPGSQTGTSGLTFSTSPITTTGSISLSNTAVTPGSYTCANITADQQGRITSAANGTCVGSVSIDSLTAATLNTVSASASIAFNGNNGTLQTVTLNTATTVTLSNLKVGIPYTFIVKQDGTGSRTLAWTSSLNVKVAYGGGGTPPISTAASAIDKYSMTSDGTNIYVDYALNYN